MTEIDVDKEREEFYKEFERLEMSRKILGCVPLHESYKKIHGKYPEPLTDAEIREQAELLAEIKVKKPGEISQEKQKRIGVLIQRQFAYVSLQKEEK